ncbi:MAG: membrane protein insertase YidC [Tannerella sp.]|jgi:YidC/Oxa1 family membrane protein insertase|nr:membrane protein insertase YidC [Tannerella sp.]
MSVDKNTIMGFILIGAVIMLFTWLNRPSPEQMEAMEAQRRYQDSIAQVQYAAQQPEITAAAAVAAQPEISAGHEQSDSVRASLLLQNYGAFAPAAEGTESFVTIENEKVELRISTKGGRLDYARLKEFVMFDGAPLVLFDGADESDFNLTLVTATNRVVNTSDLYFTSIKADAQSAVMRLSVSEQSYIDFVYTLRPDDYMFDFAIQCAGLNGILSPNVSTLDINWRQKARQLEQGRKYENQYTGLFYKYLGDDVDHLSETKDDEERTSNRLKWIGFKNKFFSTVLIAENAFHSAGMHSVLLDNSAYLKQFEATTSVSFDIAHPEPIAFKYFIGPNKYSLLRDYDKNLSGDGELTLDNLVSLGAKFFRPINKYFIIPIFEFLGHYTANYGLIIFLLTLVVKLLLFPLTYKSYMSSAKMRVLRPQVMEINDRYPKKEQAMEKQKATMDLYSRAGASPMTGCLPMLLQMPIWIALYGLFPTAFELRQSSFLWAKDLSTFDDIISWNANIPLVNSMLGNHLSLFCLLMVAVQIVYTKITMSMSDTGQQQMPGMKMMMYFMPVMMLFFFNQTSAGLSYYILISSLITIAQTLSCRLFVNEEKLLLKLEENKKKTRKKTSFMQRLEDAQRAQEQKLKQQQKQKQRTQQQARPPQRKK